MSKTLEQIFVANPITSNLGTDLMYFVQSPYTPGTDAGMTFANFQAQFQTVTPTALTRVDDTNVTLTLGGTPATSLLQAVSLTLGWTGILSGTRGGTGVNNGASLITVGANFTMSGAFAFTGTLTGITGVTFPTSGTLATTSQLPTPAALTRVDDTNVTLTLGGTPATALLQATSLTLGWTGQLNGTRGGTGVNNGVNTATFAGNLNFANSFTTSGNFAVTQTYTGITNITFPTSGTLATTSQLLTSPLTTKGDIWVWSTTNDRLPVATGDGKILQILASASTGLAYSTPTYPSASGSAGQIMRSDGTNNLYTTTTYPNTNAINTIMYASSANVLGVISAANNGLLVTSSTGVPSILAGPGTTGNMLISNSAAAPSFTTFTYPTTVGATGSVHISDGTNIVSSTSLWPNTVGTNRKVVISNGTSNVYSTETYAVPGTSGNVMTSDGTNWTSAAPATGGTVTSVATAGLATGGTITSTGTVTVTAAVQSDMEAASSTTTAVTPAVVKYHPGVAKVWIQANGAGTTINTSYNVTSITDTGTGQLTINYTTSFSGTSYATTSCIGGAINNHGQTWTSAGTGSVLIQNRDSTGSVSDPTNYAVAIFGDQ